jgi:hypothetical protein
MPDSECRGALTYAGDDNKKKGVKIYHLLHGNVPSHLPPIGPRAFLQLNLIHRVTFGITMQAVQ